MASKSHPIAIRGLIIQIWLQLSGNEKRDRFLSESVVLATYLERNNRFREAEFIRALSTRPYSVDLHLVQSLFYAVALFKQSTDKAVSNFFESTLALKAESSTDEYWKLFNSVLNNFRINEALEP